MFSEERRVKVRASLDISPLLDVAFLLLIFFAVTTTFLEDSGLQLELPESSTAGPTQRQPAVVSVAADGTIEFRGRVLSAEELERVVSELPPEELARITLRADSNVGFGNVVRVFDALRRAGAELLSLPMRTTDPEARAQQEPGGRQPDR